MSCDIEVKFQADMIAGTLPERPEAEIVDAFLILRDISETRIQLDCGDRLYVMNIADLRRALNACTATGDE